MTDDLTNSAPQIAADADAATKRLANSILKLAVVDEPGALKAGAGFRAAFTVAEAFAQMVVRGLADTLNQLADLADQAAESAWKDASRGECHD
jgi:hypothetical protein